MHPDLLLLGSSVALASSHTADLGRGYVDKSFNRANYLGLTDLSNQIADRTGKKFCAANLSCLGGMTSDAWMIAAKTVEFKKSPKVCIYETVSRDLFDASMAPIGEGPYFRYLSSIHPKFEHQLPPPLTHAIDAIRNSKLFTSISIVFADDQVFSSPDRVRKSIDSIFCAVSNLYGNRVSVSGALIDFCAGAMKRPKTSDAASSLAAKIENKKKNPFAKLSDSDPGFFSVDESPQLMRFEQERVYFTKLLKICAQNSIKLIVVNMPTQPGYKHLVPAGLRNRTTAETYDLARASGTQVIDMDRPGVFTPDDFIDLGHMSQSGSLKLNQLLAEELEKTHSFDDVQPTAAR